MIQILPAIIPKSFRELEDYVEKIKDLTDFIHFDVTDGRFGEGKSGWPFEGDRGEFKEILGETRGLPFWEDVDYEVHLLTSEPLSYVRDWITAGASRIIVHVEKLDYENDIQFLDQLKSEGLVELGICINAETELEDVRVYLPVVDFVQVMTISSVGAQGLPFDERGIEHVRTLRQEYPEMIISVDGAMNPEKAELAIEAGANRIVVGSYIFKSVNPREALRELQELV